MVLYRGYSDPERILELSVGNIFEEPSFISSSTNEAVAHHYAAINDVDTPAFSICKYEANTPMLYFDKAEDEWLLLPSEYKVIGISDAVIRSGKNKTHIGKAFYIQKVN